MMTNRAKGWCSGLAAVLLLTSVACTRADRDTAQDSTLPEAAAEANRSDAWITTNIQAKYFADTEVRGRNIDVTTETGVVTLRGTVEDDLERRQAVALAQSVDGVQRVHDQLVLAPEDAVQRGAAETEATPDSPRRDTDMTETINAAWITSKIQAQYFTDPDVKGWDIDVTTTSDGVVTLTGEVDSVQSRDRAVQVARATDGVRRVEDHLRLEGDAAASSGTAEGDDNMTTSEAPGGDAWITAKIQSKYFLDDEVKGHEINVDTAAGRVTLRGEVENDAQRRQAVALARNTDGVASVNDELRVVPDGAEEPHRDGDVAERVADGWITTKIQSKYFLDDQVKGSKLDVDTKDGVVTLTGELESTEARQAAEVIARETQGVKRVINRIAVAPASASTSR
jgi:osmotically-inducible protein OsmY